MRGMQTTGVLAGLWHFRAGLLQAAPPHPRPLSRQGRGEKVVLARFGARGCHLGFNFDAGRLKAVLQHF